MGELKLAHLELNSGVDPARMFFGIRRRGTPCFLLESGASSVAGGRHSVLGFDPLLYIRVDNSGGADPLRVLERSAVLDRIKSCGLPYFTPCVGYLSYDYVRYLYGIRKLTVDDLRQPILEFMVPSKVVVVDHVMSKTHFVFLSLGRGKAVADIRAELKALLALARYKSSSPANVRPRVSCNMSRGEFEKMVREAKGYIRAGEVIQVVLSRRFRLSPCPDLEMFYKRLRRINPSPYMFFLDFLGWKVVGSSPEVLVRKEGREVTTRPIAGTRRRGLNSKDEELMERELIHDEKERAEHVMLVDLARNDLGKVSEFGSVRVTEFMRVEKYSHVQHLVSNVVGKVREGTDAFDILRATFPAGTVTGAPKVRAMEIIEELEPTSRGIYAGAVGFFSFTGDADFAITIRTLVAGRDAAYIQVGAGIVADSIPSQEYLETQNKARALLVAAGVRQ